MKKFKSFLLVAFVAILTVAAFNSCGSDNDTEYFYKCGFSATTTKGDQTHLGTIEEEYEKAFANAGLNIKAGDYYRTMGTIDGKIMSACAQAEAAIAKDGLVYKDGEYYTFFVNRFTADNITGRDIYTKTYGNP